MKLDGHEDHIENDMVASYCEPASLIDNRDGLVNQACLMYFSEDSGYC